MNASNYQLEPFFKEVESQLKLRETNPLDEQLFEDIAPIYGECFFVVDLSQSKILHFGGMKKLFGYNEKSIDLPFVFDKNHPEDSHLVQLLVSNILSKIVTIEIPNHTNIFSVTSRFKKKNGDYLRIMTDNFIIQTNEQNLVQSILVRYTDLSFMNDSDTVDWKVNANYLDLDQIAKEVYGPEKNVFTQREKEIILFMFKGISNPIIASDLNISPHTVATHRKNIFSKSKCSNIEELKRFCKKYGVFNGKNF